MICDIIFVDGFLCMSHLDIVHMLSAYVHVIHTLSGHMRIMRTLFAVVLDIFLPNRQCRCHPYVCKQYTDHINNMCVCRQCTETQFWIIGYTRSVRDDTQIMCTCADHMQMTWTMCICVDNIQKLSCT